MLTKSNYIKHLQCQKYLWLNKFKPELLPEDIDNNLQRAFATGYAVEELAYQLFPGGVIAGEGEIREVIARSKKLIQAKTPLIFQATVSGKDLFCRADIIRYNEVLKAWDIIEVKSATEIKDIYIDDLAFQKICFEEAGLRARLSYAKLNIMV